MSLWNERGGKGCLQTRAMLCGTDTSFYAAKGVCYLGGGRRTRVVADS